MYGVQLLYVIAATYCTVESESEMEMFRFCECGRNYNWGELKPKNTFSYFYVKPVR